MGLNPGKTDSPKQPKLSHIYKRKTTFIPFGGISLHIFLVSEMAFNLSQRFR